MRFPNCRWKKKKKKMCGICCILLPDLAAINVTEVANIESFIFYKKTTIVLLTVGVIKIVLVINCNLITFFKIIENNCNSVFTLITIIEM